MRSRNKLRQSQKMEAVGQLTGGIAHDFNNILMVILANADALQEDEKLDAASCATASSRSTRPCRRAADLTRQLLAFSRKQPLQPKRTDLNDLVTDTGKLLRRALGEQIEIDSVLADDLWTVNVDRAQLETALVNLCVNARDAMPDGGRLLIETRNVTLDEDNVAQTTDVARRRLCDARRHRHRQRHAAGDAGQGVRAVLHHQGGRQGNRPRPQHGLRLHQAVQRPHHDLQRSRPRNHVQALPAAQRRRRAEAAVAGRRRRCRAAASGSWSSRTNRRSAPASCSSCRAWATTSSRRPMARPALAAFEAASPPYDLLLTDVVMPGPMNGKALADEVARRWPQTKVVFMSGYTENAIVHHGTARRRRAAAEQAVPQGRPGANRSRRRSTVRLSSSAFAVQTRERTEAECRHLMKSTGSPMKRIVPTASAISIIEAVPGVEPFRHPALPFKMKPSHSTRLHFSRAHSKATARCAYRRVSMILQGKLVDGLAIRRATGRDVPHRASRRSKAGNARVERNDPGPGIELPPATPRAKRGP